MKKLPFLFICLLLFNFGAFSSDSLAATDPSTLTTKIDKSEATIGEPVRLTIGGTMAKSQTIPWPQTIEGLKGLSIVTSGYKESFPLFGQKSFKGWFILKGYEPGSFDIPSFTLKFYGSDGVERSLATQKSTLVIKSLVQGDIEKLDVKDIKGFYKPFPLKIFLLMAALILSLAAWLVYVKITTKPLNIFVPPPVPAHIVALEKIKELERKDLVNRGKIADFYFELSMIVRQYLEARFSLRAPEMTTEEFLASLRESGVLSLNHKQRLKDFLSHCDMVKFAKYGPGTEEIAATLGSAKTLIEETVPHDAP